MISPEAQVLEQTKSDLKWGWYQTDVLDEALERDAKKKRQSQARKAHKAKIYKTKKQQRMPWLWEGTEEYDSPYCGFADTNRERTEDGMAILIWRNKINKK